MCQVPEDWKWKETRCDRRAVSTEERGRILRLERLAGILEATGRFEQG